MISRHLGLAGSFGVLLSLFLPMMLQLERNVGFYGTQVSRVHLALYSPLLALLLLVSVGVYGFLWWKNDERLERASWVLLGLVGLVLLVVVRDGFGRDDTMWRGMLPVYPHFGGGSVFQFACFTLPLSAALCWLASRFVSEEAQAPSSAPSSSALLAPPQPALPKDAGRCANCQSVNSKAATQCRNCRALLPWAQPKVSLPASAPVRVQQPARSGPRFSLPTLDGGSLASIGGYIATCVFCWGAPLLGFFLWRYMDKEDSRYASTAFIATVLGFVFHVGRFAWKFVQVGSSL